MIITKKRLAVSIIIIIIIIIIAFVSYDNSSNSDMVIPDVCPEGHGVIITRRSPDKYEYNINLRNLVNLRNPIEEVFKNKHRIEAECPICLYKYVDYYKKKWEKQIRKEDNVDVADQIISTINKLIHFDKDTDVSVYLWLSKPIINDDLVSLIDDVSLKYRNNRTTNLIGNGVSGMNNPVEFMEVQCEGICFYILVEFKFKIVKSIEITYFKLLHRPMIKIRIKS